MATTSRKWKKFLKGYYSPKIYWWEWATVVAICLITILSVVYQDTISITVWSTNLWDVIIDGKLTDFYKFTTQNIHHVPHDKMGCDLFTIIPLSIWNIPIWIAQRFFGKEIPESGILIAWSKLGLEACNGLVAYLAYKMAMLLTKDKNRSLWASFLTMSFCGGALGIGIAGQTDVFVIVYTALSVYSMMKGQKKRSVLFAAMSVAAKPFFVFAYLPLILLKQKNIFIAALEFILSFSLMGLNRMIGQMFPLYNESMSSGPSVTVLVNLFGVGIDSFYGQASLFLIGLLVIYLISYMTNPKSDQERNEYYLYIVVAVYLLMSVFSKTEFYRFILTMPFLSVLVVLRSSMLRFNLFLSFVFQFFVTMCNALGNWNTVSAYFMRGSVVSLFFQPDDMVNERKAANIRAVVNAIDEKHNFLGFILYLTTAISIAAVILILVLNFPRYKHKFDMERLGIFEKYDHGLLLLNGCSFLPFLLAMYIMYFHYLYRFY